MFSRFIFSLSIDIGSSFKEEFFCSSIEGSGLLETSGSSVFFLGAGASKTDFVSKGADFSSIGSSQAWGFYPNVYGSFFSKFMSFTFFSTAYKTGAFSIKFSLLTSIFSGGFILVVSPFIKLSNKCIKIGTEGSACGNPILSQI